MPVESDQSNNIELRASSKCCDPQSITDQNNYVLDGCHETRIIFLVTCISLGSIDIFINRRNINCGAFHIHTKLSESLMKIY